MVIRHERALPNATAPILVGHDGSPSSGRALQWASDLAQSIGAEVVAAHVWQTASSEVRPRLHRRLSKGARESVERWAGEVSSAIRPLELEGEPRIELVSLAQRLDAGLLVVGPAREGYRPGLTDRKRGRLSGDQQHDAHRDHPAGARRGRILSGDGSRDTILWAARAVESEPTLLGLGPHLLLVATVPSTAPG